jgi:hypothetical protein
MLGRGVGAGGGGAEGAGGDPVGAGLSILNVWSVKNAAATDPHVQHVALMDSLVMEMSHLPWQKHGASSHSNWTFLIVTVFTFIPCSCARG